LAGLPNEITSPGRKVYRSERAATTSGGEKSISSTVADCRRSPEITVSIPIPSRSTSVSIHGPSGADPSKAFRAVRRSCP
jgi:hypothetical protein